MFVGKTSYLLAGDEAGEKKIEKAREKKVKIIDEDQLFELIKTRPGKKSKYEIMAENEAKVTPKKSKKISPKKKLAAEKNADKPVEKNSETKSLKSDKKQLAKPEEDKAQENKQTEVTQKTPPQLWVEKYKPQTLGKIVGQSGAASCAKKLLNWLRDWQKNQGCSKE